MSSKAYSLDYEFPCTFSILAKAFWVKYSHPSLDHVKHELVLDRRINEQGQLVTRRVICVQQRVPWALQSFTGGLDRFYALEETVIDAKQETLSLKSTNLSFSRIMVR